MLMVSFTVLVICYFASVVGLYLFLFCAEKSSVVQLQLWCRPLASPAIGNTGVRAPYTSKCSIFLVTSEPQKLYDIGLHCGYLSKIKYRSTGLQLCEPLSLFIALIS